MRTLFVFLFAIQINKMIKEKLIVLQPFTFSFHFSSLHPVLVEDGWQHWLQSYHLQWVLFSRAEHC